MHAGHKVIKCRRHAIVIMQCRCADANKPVEYQDECAHDRSDVEIARLRTALSESQRESEELRGYRRLVMAMVGRGAISIDAGVSDSGDHWFAKHSGWSQLRAPTPALLADLIDDEVKFDAIREARRGE